MNRNNERETKKEREIEVQKDTTQEHKTGRIEKGEEKVDGRATMKEKER